MEEKADDMPSTERGRRTRASLVQAAREVFEKKGFLDARISDITSAAEVAQGTFYTYFESKKDIWAEVAQSFAQQIYESTVGVGAETDDPYAQIELANRRFLEAYRRESDLFAVVEQMATYDNATRQIRRRMRSIFVRRAARSISRLQAQGLAYGGLNPHYAATALGSMVDNFAYVWLVLEEPFDEEEAIYTLSVLWARAIGLPVPGHENAGSSRLHEGSGGNHLEQQSHRVYTETPDAADTG